MAQTLVIERNKSKPNPYNSSTESELNNKLEYEETVLINGSDVLFKKDFQKITFNHNLQKPIHRWTPYIQGFSSDFVERILNKEQVSNERLILDPFAGCGTVNVSSKMRGIDSIGVDLNPLMKFILETKLNWDVNTQKIWTEFKKLDWGLKPTIEPPMFLLSYRQFDRQVLNNLLIIKESISNVDDNNIRNLFKLAFVSILTRCSRLKRSPSLGYDHSKIVHPNEPFEQFTKKVEEFIIDLEYVKNLEALGNAKIICENAKTYKYEQESIDLVITSPPYVNGIDYVINYKIELAWLDLVKSQQDLRKLKEQMVVCDNVSRGAISHFSTNKKAYSNKLLEAIVEQLEEEMMQRKYRRNDMHFVVKKYFDDMYKVMKNVYDGLKEGGKFIIVIGDSLIADVYIPADLLLAQIGSELGFKPTSIIVARKRRTSRDSQYRLRESIVTLQKVMK